MCDRARLSSWRGPRVMMFERSLAHCSGQFMGQLLLLHPHREPFIINKLEFSQSGLPCQHPARRAELQ
jgi:hypothetical protein